MWRGVRLQPPAISSAPLKDRKFIGIDRSSFAGGGVGAGRDDGDIGGAIERLAINVARGLQRRDFAIRQHLR